jgi:hypothetical protein
VVEEGWNVAVGGPSFDRGGALAAVGPAGPANVNGAG